MIVPPHCVWFAKLDANTAWHQSYELWHTKVPHDEQSEIRMLVQCKAGEGEAVHSDLVEVLETRDTADVLRAPAEATRFFKKVAYYLLDMRPRVVRFVKLDGVKYLSPADVWNEGDDSSERKLHRANDLIKEHEAGYGVFSKLKDRAAMLEDELVSVRAKLESRDERSLKEKLDDL
jgi:hypothetical protein